MKFQKFTPTGCKDIRIRTFEFVAKTQFLSNHNLRVSKKIKILTFYLLPPNPQSEICVILSEVRKNVNQTSKAAQPFNKSFVFKN